MRLSRQLQARFFFFFTKRFHAHKKHQNGKQGTFILLKVCAREKLLPLLFSVCLTLFCWLMFACECFLCSRNLLVKKKKKKKQAWNCLDNLISLYYRIFIFSRKEKPNNYKIVEGKNLVIALSNQSHRFMTIFGNNNFFILGKQIYNKIVAKIIKK